MPCWPNFCLALQGSELITQARDSHLLPCLDLLLVLCSSPDSLCTHKSQNVARVLAKGEESKREKRNADGWEAPVKDSQGADRLVMLFWLQYMQQSLPYSTWWGWVSTPGWVVGKVVPLFLHLAHRRDTFKAKMEKSSCIWESAFSPFHMNFLLQ